MAINFAANWAENGAPNPLAVHVKERQGSVCSVTLRRRMLHPETLEPVDEESLADALEAQGLAKYGSVKA